MSRVVFCRSKRAVADPALSSGLTVSGFRARENEGEGFSAKRKQKSVISIF
jgi:hypothetical protein